MGEVAMPRGMEIGKQREAFRAFMLARRLRPTEWARAAGVPSGEILAFLAGQARAIAPQTLEKLARAARLRPGGSSCFRIRAQKRKGQGFRTAFF